ncbi:MAG: ribonuclease HII [Zestosphaera tikiterensis]|uniref:Ribonuclease n=1 Tax=Zestosphaera tikiterensis TaxID=1973259 RepID=A0A2R7Y5K1_9CREN|nr:MAG: ribonuclease HII [Zestosphaera tikiterensis]
MILKEVNYLLGIDEAGRGPVIGDMFLVCVALTEQNEGRLKDIGVKDSKKLTPSARARLFPKIIEVVDAVVVKRYPPHVIDAHNLNDLFVEGVNELVRESFKLGLKVRRIYIDALSSRKHKTNLLSKLPEGVEVIYEFKADVKYPIVSAASIIAKYLRDQHIRYLHSIYGDFGSGYPSDPKTVEWLKNVAQTKFLDSRAEIVRKSWLTIRRLVRKDGSESSNLLKWFKK